jgi:toxin YoeB
MAVTFYYTAAAIRDLKDWKKRHRNTELATIKDIEREIAKNPTAWEGKYSPELLKYDMAGWYSRRITVADQFVYRPRPENPEAIEVIQCRGHY